MVQAEAWLGSAFVYNPTRWGTADGYVPWRVFAAVVRGLPALKALERLQMARAVVLGNAGEHGRGQWDADTRTAKGD